MNIFELFGTIVINNKGANDALKDTAQKAERAGRQIQEAFKKVGSATVKAGQTVGKAAIAVGTAWTATIEATRDYRTAMAKLDTAFVTNGHSADTATKTYKALQAVLGDTGQATEAANHLAVMCDSEADLAKWTNVCTGIFSTFGESLPIEGLTEAANETAKVGTVTGTLADALNWAGVSEEDFNLKLRACRTEQERQKLILNTLYPMYRDAADQYKENAEGIMKANEANDNLSSAMAKLGAVGEPILTGIKNWIANMVNAAVPHLETLITKFGQIDSVWQDVIWPLVQSTFKVAFGVDVPEWETVESNIAAGWETVKAGIAGYFQTTFGITLPTDWQSMIDSLSAGWNTIQTGIAGFFQATFGITLPTNWSEMVTDLTTGWNTIQTGIAGFFQTTFGITLPTNWSEMVTDLTTGWNTIQTGIEGFFEKHFNITPPDLSELMATIKTDWAKYITIPLTSLLTGNRLTIVPVIGQALATLITSNWDEHIKPTLDGYLNQELGIALPDWEQMGDDITNGLGSLVTTDMKEALGAIGGGLVEAFGTGTEIVTTVLSGAKEFGQWCVDNKGTVAGFFGILAGTAMEGAEGAVSFIQLALDAIKGLAGLGIESVTSLLKWMMENGEAVALGIQAVAAAFLAASIAAHPYATAVTMIAGALGLMYERNADGDPFNHWFDKFSDEDLATLQKYVDAVNAYREAGEALTKDENNADLITAYRLAGQRMEEAYNQASAIDGLLETYHAWRSGQAENTGKDLYLDVPLRVDETSESNIQDEIGGMSFEATVKMKPDYSGLSTVTSSLGGYTRYSRPTFTAHAKGLDFVPRDGYLARLHYGEAVLNRTTADMLRSGGMGNTSKLEALLAQMMGIMQQVAANTSGGTQVVLDSGAVVGQLAPAIDSRLGTISSRKGRGN